MSVNRTSATAVALYAHGARNPEWAAPLLALQKAIEARGMNASVAFLELQAPALPEVLDDLAASHASIQVLPVFWAEAGHVRNELPVMLEAARARHPAVRITQLATLSQVPGLIEFLAAYATSAGSV
jgi:sirohydrochlorin cobaltochelatase